MCVAFSLDSARAKIYEKKNRVKHMSIKTNYIFVTAYIRKLIQIQQHTRTKEPRRKKSHPCHIESQSVRKSERVVLL